MSPAYRSATTTHPKATIHTAGGDVVIEASSAGADRPYAASVARDGSPLDRLYITHDEMTSAGTLTFEMSGEPSGAVSEGLPFSMSTADGG